MTESVIISIPTHVPLRDDNPEFRIVEIFESLQGEGYNTGMSAIFIRLGRCDLTCSWCDTDYFSYNSMTLLQIIEKLQDYTAKNIIITGGEPAIHPRLTTLLDALKSRGYYLCIETNGLHQVPPQIDYIATSPKACYAERYQSKGLNKVDEVRIVVDVDAMTERFSGENGTEEAVKGSDLSNAERQFIYFAQSMAQKISAKRYYLSPLEIDGQMNIYQTIRLIGLLNLAIDGDSNPVHWQLSVQTHKWAGIE